MGGIDPQLLILMRQSGDLDGAPALGAGALGEGAASSFKGVVAGDDDGPQARVLVHFTCDPADVTRAGLRITSMVGDVAAGFVAVKHLKGLAKTKGVVYVEASRPLTPETDLSLVDARVVPLHTAVPPRRGAGVIVGIVDSGINVEHGCFCTRDEATGELRTRIRAIWDQTVGKPFPTDRVPEPFGYGVVYDERAINEVLRVRAAGGDTSGVFQHAGGTHCTYVAGIAAGNGSALGTVGDIAGRDFLLDERGYQGVAPEADIVVVNYKRNGFMEGSAFVLDALSFIFRVADEARLPAVINLSQGDSVGPHDGTSLLERAIDNLLGGPGRVMVKSAGNLGLEKTHAAGEVPPSGGFVLPVEVNQNAGKLCTIDIWYEADARLGVSVCQPGGGRVKVIEPDAPPDSFPLPNGNLVELSSATGDPLNGDNRIFIQVRAGELQHLEAGRWALVLSSLNEAGASFHAWIDTPALNRGSTEHPRFAGDAVSPECTVTIPGTSRKIITVTASMTRRAGDGAVVGGFAELSSLGPTRDAGRTGHKPDLAAPGMNIVSALNRPNGKRQYILLGGTSAAAAHVSGAAALLLAENPLLTQEQVKELLCRHAITELTDAPPGRNGWGAGKLDASAAHAALLAESQIGLQTN